MEESQGLATDLENGMCDRDMINIARHASTEGFHDVLKRVVAAQPKIYMVGHEGYYRHDDIARLIIELSDPQTLAYAGGAK
jgi:hypothetical protein